MANICLALIAAITLASPLALAKSAIDQAKANIPRFRIVSDGIFAGGNPLSKAEGDKGREAIVSLGIRGVVSFQGGDIDDTWKGRFAEWRQKGENPEAVAEEKAWFESRGLTWFNAPLNSHEPKTPIEDRDIMEALRRMSTATKDHPIYIHCEHGADRTGMLVALYRVIYQGWSPEDAYREWLQNGHTWVARVFTYHLDNYFFEKTGWSPVRAAAVAMQEAQAELEIKVNVQVSTCAEIIVEK